MVNERIMPAPHPGVASVVIVRAAAAQACNQGCIDAIEGEHDTAATGRKGLRGLARGEGWQVRARSGDRVG